MTDVRESLVAARYTYRRNEVICYAIETVADVIDEIIPLLWEHHREVSAYPDIPLDPNFEFYRKANEVGLVRIYTARRNTELVGYAVYTLLARHPDYDARWAVSAAIFVAKPHRNLRIANGLFDFVEADLEGYVVQTHTTLGHPALGALLRRRGHDKIHDTYSLRL